MYWTSTKRALSFATYTQHGVHYLIETRMCFPKCVYAFGWLVVHDGSRASLLAKESVKRWLSMNVLLLSRVVDIVTTPTHAVFTQILEFDQVHFLEQLMAMSDLLICD
jgi:hypothetical protein